MAMDRSATIDSIKHAKYRSRSPKGGSSPKSADKTQRTVSPRPRRGTVLLRAAESLEIPEESAGAFKGRRSLLKHAATVNLSHVNTDITVFFDNYDRVKEQ